MASKRRYVSHVTLYAVVSLETSQWSILVNFVGGHTNLLTTSNAPLSPSQSEDNGSKFLADDDEDSYVPYVSVKQRKQNKLERLAAVRKPTEAAVDKLAAFSSDEEAPKAGPMAGVSLIDQVAELQKKNIIKPKTEIEKEIEQQQEIEKAQMQHKSLFSDYELAKGIVYTESIKTRYSIKGAWQISCIFNAS
jgi:hypothetical protein